MTGGLHYKHITIVNDDTRVISKRCESSVVSSAPNCGIIFARDSPVNSLFQSC